MAEKDIVVETEEKELVSKNFIEQEIDKDLAEGVYTEVCTRFPPEPISTGTKWLSAYRTCQVYSFKLWTGTEI